MTIYTNFLFYILLIFTKAAFFKRWSFVIFLVWKWVLEFSVHSYIPSVSVNFISLVTSCAWLWEEAQTAYMQQNCHLLIISQNTSQGGTIFGRWLRCIMQLALEKAISYWLLPNIWKILFWIINFADSMKLSSLRYLALGFRVRGDVHQRRKTHLR